MFGCASPWSPLANELETVHGKVAEGQVVDLGERNPSCQVGRAVCLVDELGPVTRTQNMMLRKCSAGSGRNGVDKNVCE